MRSHFAQPEELAVVVKRLPLSLWKWYLNTTLWRL